MSALPRVAGAAVGLMLAGAALGGCGGGGGKSTQLTTAAAPAKQAGNPPHRPPGRAQHPSPSHAKPHPATHQAPTPAQHAALSQRVMSGVLATAGLRGASVNVGADGTSIQATVTPTQACAASETQEQIAAQVERLLSYVHSVTITVADSGKSLTEYESTVCGSSALPSGKGNVILTLKGTGTKTTNAFTIHAARWTIDYVNSGRAMDIFPFNGSKPVPGGVVAKPHSSGSKVEQGAGTYTLRILALGSWTVRVRDGT